MLPDDSVNSHGNLEQAVLQIAIGAMGFVVFLFGLGCGYSLTDTGRPEAVAVDRSV
jgi:hypothetical protein